MTRKGLSLGLAHSGAYGGQQSAADMVSGQPRSSVPLAQIDPPKRNPRGQYSQQPVTSEGEASLAASIRERGVIQPILLRPVGSRYEVVAGERRYRAALQAGLMEIPAVVRPLTDDEAFEVAVIENTNREDMPLVDLALAAFEVASVRTGKAVGEMPALFLALKNGTIEDQWQLAEMLQSVMGPRGSSFSSFAQTHSRYLQMTEIEVQALRDGTIQDAVARALTRLPQEHPERPKLLDQAVQERLPAAEVEARVKALLDLAATKSAFQQQIQQVRKALPALSRLKDGDQRRARAEALIAELISLTE